METEKQKNARKDFQALFKEPFKNFGGLIIWILVLSYCLSGCKEGNISVKSTLKGGEVITESGIFTKVRELNEFEYKGHTYISCDVRDGIALTHAGHCWCNGNKK